MAAIAVRHVFSVTERRHFMPENSAKKHMQHLHFIVTKLFSLHPVCAYISPGAGPDS
jgi:hypothetical protein